MLEVLKTEVGGFRLTGVGGIKRRDGPVGSLLQLATVCNLEGFSSGLDELDTDLGWTHKKVFNYLILN